MESRAVVVVHGIGDGTGADRSEFSSALRNNVRKELSPGASLIWVEANWEVLNDAIDRLWTRKFFPDVCNREVKSGKKLISAHCAYWNDVSIAKTISGMLTEK